MRLCSLPRSLYPTIVVCLWVMHAKRSPKGPMATTPRDAFPNPREGGFRPTERARYGSGAIQEAPHW